MPSGNAVKKDEHVHGARRLQRVRGSGCVLTLNGLKPYQTPSPIDQTRWFHATSWIPELS